MGRKLTRKPVVTLAEAAEMFGVKVDTLRRAVLTGRLSALKSGKVWLVRPNSVASAIRQRRLRKGEIPEGLGG